MKTSWAKATPVLLLNMLVFWPLYMLMTGVLWVIGYALITKAAKQGRYWWAKSIVWPDRVIMVWAGARDWMNFVWGNAPDGVDRLALAPEDQRKRQAWWFDKTELMDYPNRIIRWSAFRNSTNNLRFMHYFVPWLGWINPKTINPTKIRWSGTLEPLSAVLEKWKYPHMESCAEEMILVAPGGYKKRFACLFVRQGLYCGLKIVVRVRDRAVQIWFGWKLNAGMSDPNWWPEDPCWKGIGFTCGQVRRLK